MALVGSGGHPPDFSVCSRCRKKGLYLPRSHITKNNVIYNFPITCKYCGYRKGKITKKRL